MGVPCGSSASVLPRAIRWKKSPGWWTRKERGGTDLIALPETWRGQDEKSPETLEGPTITTIARLAQKHQTYIVCPIDRKEGKRRYNSAVLLDRRGQVVSVYNKLYPVWQVECMKEAPQQAGAPR